MQSEMNKLLTIILIFACLLFLSCASGSENMSANEKEPLKDITEKSDATETSDIKDKKISKTEPKTSCSNLKRGGMKPDEKQTFAIDFKPFQTSCFATFQEPDFDGSAIGEKFFIYKDGKEVFEFPDQNQAAGYSVEAVSFQDFNGDGLKEVIVLGSVDVKSGKMFSSQIFVNNGKGFTTDRKANFKLDDLEKMKDVIDFVKDNREIFFK